MQKSEKTKTQQRAKAVFVRIDTMDSKPLLEKRSCVELVTTFLFNFRQQQWFNLIGFVVLPREITVNSLVSRLEKEITPILGALIQLDGALWDPEIYSETLEGMESVRSRLYVMQAAPVKLRLASSPDTYDFSSANPRYQNDLDRFER